MNLGFRMHKAFQMRMENESSYANFSSHLSRADSVAVNNELVGMGAGAGARAVWMPPIPLSECFLE